MNRTLDFHSKIEIGFTQNYLEFEREDYGVLAFLGDTGALYGVLL